MQATYCRSLNAVFPYAERLNTNAVSKGYARVCTYTLRCICLGGTTFGRFSTLRLLLLTGAQQFIFMNRNALLYSIHFRIYC